MNSGVRICFTLDALGVVVACAVRNGQILGEVRVGVVQPDGCEHEKQDSSDDSVGDGVPWEHERTESEPSDLSPVESNWDKTKSSLVAKQLVDNNVVWCDPSGESKV